MKMLAEDIAAFVNVLGLDNPDLVWSLANVDWQSDDDRNQFIAEIGTMTGPVQA